MAHYATRTRTKGGCYWTYIWQYATIPITAAYLEMSKNSLRM